MRASDFDKKFDSGEDITSDLDISKARRLNQETKRINVDFPTLGFPTNATVPDFTDTSHSLFFEKQREVTYFQEELIYRFEEAESVEPDIFLFGHNKDIVEVSVYVRL